MISRRVIGALVGGAAFVVVGTASATPPTSPSPHVATTAHAPTAAPQGSPPPTEHGVHASPVIHLSSAPHAPEGEIHLVPSLLTPQRRLAILETFVNATFPAASTAHLG